MVGLQKMLKLLSLYLETQAKIAANPHAMLAATFANLEHRV
jgi:hypothetical protein